MFTKSDTLLQQQLAAIGKLTVPSKQRSVLQQKTAIDELRHNLHTPEQQQASLVQESANQPQLEQVEQPSEPQPPSLVMIDTGRTTGAPDSNLTRLTRNTMATAVVA